MRVPFLIAATTALMLAAAPAIGQTPKQNARDSTGIANFQKQHGGQKHDRQINRTIFRNAHNRMRADHDARDR